jgi:protein-disulfide isomerase
VTGTPAFLINGEPIIGAQPTSTFAAAVKKAAATAR